MNVKLSMVSCSYKENAEKKTITAIIKTKSVIGIVDEERYITVGVAKCNDNNVYDIEKGKGIARAKAEKEAYVNIKSFQM